jgi:hypothetical protein
MFEDMRRRDFRSAPAIRGETRSSVASQRLWQPDRIVARFFLAVPARTVIMTAASAASVTAEPGPFNKSFTESCATPRKIAVCCLLMQRIDAFLIIRTKSFFRAWNQLGSQSSESQKIVANSAR